MKNIKNLESAIHRVFDELEAMDDDSFNKLLLEHENGDIAQLLYHSNAFILNKAYYTESPESWNKDRSYSLEKKPSYPIIENEPFDQKNTPDLMVVSNALLYSMSKSHSELINLGIPQNRIILEVSSVELAWVA